jgi:glutathione synthase/RimK-type ligase-like ATP-grasp enzyme
VLGLPYNSFVPQAGIFMKIAIHKSKADFSERWIKYCTANNIPFKLVNCYSNSIVNDLEDCSALLWHHNHALPQDQLIAKQILFSIEHSGKLVFPDFKTNWHFDDKLGQKYLFEALSLPSVRSYAFYSEDEALAWLNETKFPKVFKLRKGAGSRNVFLIHSKKKAHKLIKKAFGPGFRQYDPWGGIKESIRKIKLGKANLLSLLKSIAHIWYPITLEKAIGRERGYIYFQDFLPDNSCDIRVVVIIDKAFAIKRNVRKNDFRASGSGLIEYDKIHFTDSLIKIAFECADIVKSQCVAIDFVFDKIQPLIVEISYGFSASGYDKCTGYWDKTLSWYPGKFDPYGWMIEDLIKQYKKKNGV